MAPLGRYFVRANRLRLRTATDNDGSVAASYWYDPLGRRTYKLGTGVTQRFFLNDGDDEIAEYDGNKNVVALYVPGPAIDEPIAMVTPNGSGWTHEFFHTNHQGSVIMMTNDNGAIVEGPFTYSPFGSCSNSAGHACPTGVPYRFTGRRWDDETGLLYFRARYYSLGLGGRFMQTDPVGYTADMNLYTYVGNDPTNTTDPYGEAGDQNCTTDSNGTTTCQPVETVVVTAQRPPAPKPPPPRPSMAGFILSGAIRAGAIEARVPEVGLPAAAITVGVGAVAAGIISLANQSDEQSSSGDQPADQDLDKVKEKDANEVAREHGYKDAHDAKKNRGGGRVNIYKDRKTGGYYIGTERAVPKRSRYNGWVMRERTVSFSLRGFTNSVDEVVKTIGHKPTATGKVGDPVKPGLSQRLKRSFVSYEQAFGTDELWDDVLLNLINRLGGASALKPAIAIIRPEFVQIDLTIPVRNSDEQEDRFISAKVLRVIADIGADLAFGFV